jgi:hypothetical protein
MGEDAGVHGKRLRSDPPDDGPEPGPAAGTIGDDEDDDVGPMPMPDTGESKAPRKKRKGVYLTMFENEQTNTGRNNHN